MPDWLAVFPVAVSLLGKRSQYEMRLLVSRECSDTILKCGERVGNHFFLRQFRWERLMWGGPCAVALCEIP